MSMNATLKYTTLINTLKTDPDRRLRDLIPLVATAQPCVLASEYNEPHDVPDIDNDTILSCPFDVFSYEFDGDDCITVDRADSNAWNLLCIVCIEVLPGDYTFVALVRHHGKHYTMRSSYDDVSDSTKLGAYNAYKSITQLVLERINNCASGTFTTSDRVKFKGGKGAKQLRKLNNVIYIGNDKKKLPDSTKSSRPLTLNTSWVVRGHWRRLVNKETIGKDKAGNRTIAGFTWVDSFFKGEGPLTTKVRRIK